MTVTIETYDLARIVKAVAPAASHTAMQNPLLTMVRLTVKDGLATARATDLDMALEATTHATGDLDICLLANVFTRLVKTLDGMQTTIFTNGTYVTFKSNNATFELPVTSAKEWPETELPTGEHTVVIDGRELAAALKRTTAAAAHDNARPSIHGVFFESRNGKLRLVATDEYRLQVEDLNAEAPEGLSAIVQLGVAQTLRNYCTNAEVSAVFSAQFATFDSFGIKLSTQLISRQYPNYGHLIPASFPHTINVDKDAVVDATRSISAVGIIWPTVSKETATALVVEIGDGVLTLRMQEGKSGTATATVTAECEPIADVRSIAVSPHHLLDALSGNVEQITIEITDALKPIRVSSCEAPGRFTMIMPIRVS